MNTETLSKFINAVGKGIPSDCETRPCASCGEPTDVPRWLPVSMHGLAACNACYDAGRAEATAQAAAAQVPDVDKLLERARIPNLPAHPLGRLTQRFLENDEKTGLFIYGKPGIGKSCQAAEFARQWCKTKRRPALYVSEVDLYQTLKDWDNNTETYHRLCTVALLVIDDLGANKATEWSSSMLYAVLDARSANGLKTLLASNVSPDHLATLPGFDERIMRRIQVLCDKPFNLENFQ